MQNGLSNLKNDRSLVTLATISGAHGLKGALKLVVDAESETLLKPGRQVILKLPSGQVQHHTIGNIKPFGRRSQLLFLDPITSREAAQVLKGAQVQVPRGILPPPEEGSYYWFDLIDLAVIDARRGFVGKLKAIMQTGAHDVYVVRAGKQETLIPVIKSVVKKVDLEKGRIEVDLPDGL